LVQGLGLTVDWYKAFQRGQDLRQVSLEQLELVLDGAVTNGTSQAPSEPSRGKVAAANTK
jgi:CDP-glucose 4,6-dehydratase